jgi:hypothetical protein
VKEYHKAHLGKDKRAKVRTKVASTLPHYPHPVWLQDSNPQNTFDSAEAAATSLAAVAANKPTAGLSTLGQLP